MKTTINLDALTGMDLWEASRTRDIDEAVAKLQDKAGIMDGGIAGMVFSGFDWSKAAVDQRVEKIKEWIETERTYAAGMAREPDGAVPGWDLGGGFTAVLRACPDGEHLTIAGPLDGIGTYVEIELEPASLERLRGILRALDAPQPALSRADTLILAAARAE